MTYKSRKKVTGEEMEAELRPHFQRGYPMYLPENGWWDLVLETHRAILAIDPDYKIAQIKEKFGQLRYYVDTSVDINSPEQHQINKIISDAEDASSKLCTKCGRKGKSWSPRYWIYTVCRYHQFIEWKRYWLQRRKYQLRELGKLVKRKKK